jgi:hypothetical protein
MKLPEEVMKKLLANDILEGTHTFVIEYLGYEYTIKYVLTINGEYRYARDYIISEPDACFEIIEATKEDEKGNIITLET